MIQLSKDEALIAAAAVGAKVLALEHLMDNAPDGLPEGIIDWTKVSELRATYHKAWVKLTNISKEAGQ
jgi:hypothetical protein